MTAKPIVPRGQARTDIEAAIDYYVGQAGEDIALGFIDALESAYRMIADHGLAALRPRVEPSWPVASTAEALSLSDLLYRTRRPY